MLTVNPNEPYMILQESYILTNYTSPKFFLCVHGWIQTQRSASLADRLVFITAPDRIMEKKTFQFTGAACLW